MIQPIQIAALLFAVIHIARLLALWKRRKLPARTAILWLLIWCAVLVIVFFTPAIDALSKPIGVGRGIDLIVYVAIMLLFYMIFQMSMKIDKLEHDMTKLARELALKK